MKRSYTVELRSGPVGDLADPTVDALADTLFRDRHIAGPVVSTDASLGCIELITSVDALGPSAAVTAAVRSFDRARRSARLDLDIVEASVALDTDGEWTDRQELVSGAEVARRLGISRQRVQQLAAAAGRFPRARGTFGTVTVWRWGDIVDWCRLHERAIARRGRRTA